MLFLEEVNIHIDRYLIAFAYLRRSVVSTNFRGNLMKSNYILPAIIAISLSGCVTNTVQEVTHTKNVQVGPLDLYGLSENVTVYSKVDMHENALGSFKRFKHSAKGYYGAFAYSSNSSGAYAQTTGHNTLKTAREYALNFCSQNLKSGDSDCQIIAILTPKGYSDKGRSTLSKNATTELKELKTTTRYNAFATNDAGYYYPVSGYKTQDLASSEAIRKCNVHAKSKTPKIQKYYPCYLIYKYK